jgi:hypothetical protein
MTELFPLMLHCHQGIVQPTWTWLLQVGQFSGEESVEGSGESQVANQPHLPGLSEYLTSDANLGEIAE